MPEFFRNSSRKIGLQLTELTTVKRKIAVSSPARLQNLAKSYLRTHSLEQATELVASLTSSTLSAREKFFVSFVQKAIKDPQFKIRRQGSPYASGGYRHQLKFVEEESAANETALPPTPLKKRRLLDYADKISRLDLPEKAVVRKAQSTAPKSDQRKTNPMGRKVKYLKEEQRTLALLPAFRELSRSEKPVHIAEGITERQARKREFLVEMGIFERNEQHPS